MTTAALAPPGSDVRAVLDALHDADPAVAERDEVAALVASVARVRGWLDAFELGCARRTKELADAGRSEPTASMFGRSGQRSSNDAAKVADRKDVCDHLDRRLLDAATDLGSRGVDGANRPDSFEQALADGRISAGHLDALAAAMSRLDDVCQADYADHGDELLHAAHHESVDAFARRCRELARRIVAAHARNDAEELDAQRAQANVKRWVDKITGMCHSHLELDPISDAAVWSLIDAQLARLRKADGNATTPWARLQVDAVIAAVTAGVVTSSTGADDAEIADTMHASRVPEITLVTDYRTLVDGLHDHSMCETEDGLPIPVSTLRRLCCDAEIIPVVLGTDGVPLDMGRSIRTANRAQRRALRTMYRTCAHPDCTVPFSACKSHHIRWWWKHHGRTDIENLVPLCEKHHHLVHEGGWALTMTPDRVTTWTRPDGIVAHHGQSINRPSTGGRHRTVRRSSG